MAMVMVEFQLYQIPREKNSKANGLTQLAATTEVDST